MDDMILDTIIDASEDVIDAEAEELEDDIERMEDCEDDSEYDLVDAYIDGKGDLDGYTFGSDEEYDDDEDDEEDDD